MLVLMCSTSTSVYSEHRSICLRYVPQIKMGAKLGVTPYLTLNKETLNLIMKSYKR